MESTTTTDFIITTKCPPIHPIVIIIKDENSMTMENMVVHRLDMDTGLVVFAWNRQAMLHK
jgi:23S rRNA-/tRNA-specific pseudouridylate synthase